MYSSLYKNGFTFSSYSCLYLPNIEEAKNSIATGTWKYAREIQPEKKKTRLTMEDIAKLANIDVKDLEIVK